MGHYEADDGDAQRRSDHPHGRVGRERGQAREPGGGAGTNEPAPAWSWVNRVNTTKNPAIAVMPTPTLPMVQAEEDDVGSGEMDPSGLKQSQRKQNESINGAKKKSSKRVTAASGVKTSAKTSVKPSTTRWLQINLRKAKVAVTELNKRRYDIALVTEPFVNRDNVELISTTVNNVHAARGTSRRACVVVKKDLTAWLVPEFTNRDICTVAIKVEGKLTYATSVYLDITNTARLPLMEDLIAKCDRKKIPLILGMDSNSNSPLWGCPEANKRGEDMETLIALNNLTVMNIGDVPTFKTSMGGKHHRSNHHEREGVRAPKPGRLGGGHDALLLRPQVHQLRDRTVQVRRTAVPEPEEGELGALPRGPGERVASDGVRERVEPGRMHRRVGGKGDGAWHWMQRVPRRNRCLGCRCPGGATSSRCIGRRRDSRVRHGTGTPRRWRNTDAT